VLTGVAAVVPAVTPILTLAARTTLGTVAAIATSAIDI
jgi:hypothetical protein